MPSNLRRWNAIISGSEHIASNHDERDCADSAFVPLSMQSDKDDMIESQALDAALVCRLGLSIDRTSAGTEFASKLVKSRMATALCVKPVRTLVAACYSVDPIMAWAAFQIIICFRSCDAFRVLMNLIRDGLIDPGPRGVLVTKWAVMKAYDRVLQELWKTDSGSICAYMTYRKASRVPHFATVSLQAFLATLSGGASLLDTLDCSRRIPLHGLKDASTVLAQWTGSKGHESTFNVDLAVQAMLSHCGVQMPSNAPGIDLMLVFCRDEQQPIAPSNLLVILFRSQSEANLDTAKAPQRFVDRFTQNGVPVIFILHEVDPQDRPFSIVREEASVRHSLNPPDNSAGLLICIR